MPSVILQLDPHELLRRNCVNLTQFLLVRSKQGLGWNRVCAAQRSNESPSIVVEKKQDSADRFQIKCYF